MKTTAQIDNQRPEFRTDADRRRPYALELEPMTDIQKNIESLITKAAKADKSDDAMRFSQAATNAANALACLENIKRGQ